MKRSQPRGLQTDGTLRHGLSVALVLATWIQAGCDFGSPSEPGAELDTCGPYPDWESSAYVLPYPAGTSFVVSQGNCSRGSHNGPARHAYDFAMPIGSPVTASRSGQVLFVVQDRPDTADPSTGENVVIVLHDDGTRAFYSHLARQSAQVREGGLVAAGELLARSGNSGSTGGRPHLHFQVTPCPDRDACGTLPVTFRNTSPNPEGLVAGVVYTAR